MNRQINDTQEFWVNARSFVAQTFRLTWADVSSMDVFDFFHLLKNRPEPQTAKNERNEVNNRRRPGT
jgi:hypothetical protein